MESTPIAAATRLAMPVLSVLAVTIFFVVAGGAMAQMPTPNRNTLQERLQPHAAEQPDPTTAAPDPAAPAVEVTNRSAPPATEDAAPTDGSAAPAPTTFDVRAFLLAPDVFPQSITDPVWTLEQQTRRRLVQIPVELRATDEDMELSDSPIKLRGARFVGFRIPAPGETFGAEGQGVNDGGQQNETHKAPRIARSVTLTPQGTLKWKLDRAIVGGTVRDPLGPSDNIFVLKLRPDVMREWQPGRMEVPQRQASEDPAAYRARLAMAQAESRAQSAAFGDLMRAVRESPDDFEEHAPPRVWAVYEMSEAIPTLDLTGPEPLPWSTTVDRLKALRAAAGATDSAEDAAGGTGYVPPTIGTPAAGGTGGAGELDGALRQNAQQFARLAQSKGEIERRMAATWLVNSEATQHAAQGNPIFMLIESLVTGPDDAASRAAIAELIRTTPSIATAKLLTRAEPRLNVEQRLSTLRQMVEATTDTAGGTMFAAKLEALKRQLHSPTGPEVATLLDLAMANLAADEEQVAATAKALDLLSLPEDRRDAALAVLVPRAGENPLATRIVETQLLTADDPAIVLATLRGLVTPHDEMEGESSGDVPPETTVAASRPLPLTDPDAPVLKLLTAEDQSLRDAAWAALSRFDLTPTGVDGTTVDGTPSRGGDAIYDRLIAAGLATGRLDEAVSLVRQEGDEAQAVRSLVKLVLEGDARSAAAGVEVLSGSGLPLEQPVSSLEKDEQRRFIGRVYDPATGQAPPVVALMEDEQAPPDMASWFAKALSETGAPSPRDWAAAYGDEVKLLTRAGSSDRAAANAAVAGLVASVGGDAEAAVSAARDIAKLTDRSQPAIQAEWQRIKRELVQKKLAALSGTFVLAAGILPPADQAATGDASVPITPLAKVDLVVDGESVRMSGDDVTLEVQQDPLRLIVPDPSQVARLAGDKLQGANLAGATAAELLPSGEGGGVWSGDATLPDGRRLRLELRSVR